MEEQHTIDEFRIISTPPKTPHPHTSARDFYYEHHERFATELSVKATCGPPIHGKLDGRQSEHGDYSDRPATLLPFEFSFQSARPISGALNHITLQSHPRTHHPLVARVSTDDCFRLAEEHADSTGEASLETKFKYFWAENPARIFNTSTFCGKKRYHKPESTTTPVCWKVRPNRAAAEAGIPTTLSLAVVVTYK